MISETHKAQIKEKLGELAFVDIVCPPARLTIVTRPHYCDRGRYLVHVESNDMIKLFLDESDQFPRYYFDFDCMMTELDLWLKARGIQ